MFPYIVPKNNLKKKKTFKIMISTVIMCVSDPAQ